MVAVLIAMAAVFLCAGCVTGACASRLPRSRRVMTSDGSTMRLEALCDEVVRLQAGRNGTTDRPTSLAVVDGHWPGVELGIQQCDDGTLVSTSRLSLRIRYEDGNIDVTSATGKAVLKGLRIIWNNTGEWTLRHALANGDAVYGLGEDNENGGRLNRRGTLHDLWAGQKIKSGNVTAEFSVPFYIVSMQDGHAVGVFIDNLWHITCDIGHGYPDEMVCQARGGPVDVYIIDGPNLPSIIDRYTRLTGRPVLPPLWALGFWQSNCVFWDWRVLETVDRELEQRNFPVDAFVIDYHWPKGINDYHWADQWYAEGRDPSERVRYFAQKGIRIVMSNSGPMLKPDASTYSSALASGVLATDGKGNPVTCGHYSGHLMDFTAPNMKSWLLPQLEPLIDAGVAAWWLDLTEPEGEPPQTVYHSGKSDDVHNAYSLLSAQVYDEALRTYAPGKRPFILTRCGPAGIQRYASLWTGDVYSDYPTYRAHPPEMLNSGLSGLGWWTSDSGGFMTGLYKNDRYGAHARLYERWMQFSVFCPITRAHKVGAPLPYEFGLATEQGCRHYLQLRYRLLPYIYSYAYEMSQTGMPLVRPLVMELQGDPRYADLKDVYFFGRELVVAPVLHEGATGRRVMLPPGKWIDWDYDCEYEGGRDWIVPAPQNRIPVFVRAGAIIPMAPYMRHTSQKPWDPITLRIWPSGESRFTMYADDGSTDRYRQGDFTITQIECSEMPGKVEVTVSSSNALYRPTHYIISLRLPHQPACVSVDGNDRLLQWDQAKGILDVTVDAVGSLSHQVVVMLSDQPVLHPEPVELPESTTAESADEAHVSGPTPRFFPPPRLPNRVMAANYDLGGEGAGFHVTRPLAAQSGSRTDDVGLVRCDDTGGGECVAGLLAGEWLSYSVDGGDGGFFDLVVRVKGGDRDGRFRLLLCGHVPLADAVVPAAGAWQDLVFRSQYLNAGNNQLMLYTVTPGFSVNYMEFGRAAAPPCTTPLEFARFAGDLRLRAAQGVLASCVEGIGRKSTGLTVNVQVPVDDDVDVVVRYANAHAMPITLMVSLGESPLTPIKLGLTGSWDTRSEAVVRLRDRAGIRPLTISASEEGSETVQVESVQIRPVTR